MALASPFESGLEVGAPSDTRWQRWWERRWRR